MPIFDLFNDTSRLPKTVTGDMPYEVGALTARETWGHGHGATTLVCRQTWNQSARWIRYMMGDAKILPSATGQVIPRLRRNLPEPLRYPEVGDGSDKRVQWCTGLSQIDQGGNPDPLDDELSPESTAPFLQGGTNWPATLWCRYQVTWETTPYIVRTEAEISDIITAANAGPVAYGGARELLRYVVRDKKTYSKEQPIPAASNAGGFRDITTGRSIGQVGFRVVQMADVTYKWVRVPFGWPPPPGWLIANPADPWPPPVNPQVLGPATVRPVRDTYIGKVNSTYFDMADPLGLAWQPEEVLYVGYDVYPYYDSSGDFVCDYTFKFKYKEGGWNKFLNASGTWVTVTLDGTATGTKPYATADFNDLFQWVAA